RRVTDRRYEAAAILRLPIRPVSFTLTLPALTEPVSVAAFVQAVQRPCLRCLCVTLQTVACPSRTLRPGRARSIRTVRRPGSLVMTRSIVPRPTALAIAVRPLATRKRVRLSDTARRTGEVLSTAGPNPLTPGRPQLALKVRM